MGVSRVTDFHNQRRTGCRAINLGRDLLTKTGDIISTLQFFVNEKVPKHVIIQYVKYILIPSVNYGAFIDIE
jgi:hypothetical protein